MNDPLQDESTPGTSAVTPVYPPAAQPLSPSKCCSQASQYVRKNPAATILYAIGTGLVLGLLVRSLRPEPEPRSRVAQMLEDIELRLRNATGPVLTRTGALAGDGVHALQDGVESGRARLKDALRDASRRFNRLLS